MAERHGIPPVHDTGASCSTTRRSQVVDVAFRPTRLEIVQEACSAEHIKGILAQKPLAANYAQAEQLVQRYAATPARPSPSTRTCATTSRSARCKTLLDRGDLGEPVLGTIEMRAIPHWMPWPRAACGWLTLRIMSIHHLDTFRYCSATRTASSSARAPIRARSSRTATASASTSSNTPTASAPPPGTTSGPGRRAKAPRPTSTSSWRVEGTEGLAPRHHRLALLPDPDAEHDRFTSSSSPACCSIRAGPRCGSPTPSRAPWARCSTRSTAARTC